MSPKRVGTLIAIVTLLLGIPAEAQYFRVPVTMVVGEDVGTIWVQFTLTGCTNPTNDILALIFELESTVICDLSCPGATSGVDFTIDTLAVSYAFGLSSTVISLPVTIIDDDVAEPDEYFEVGLTSLTDFLMCDEGILTHDPDDFPFANLPFAAIKIVDDD